MTRSAPSPAGRAPATRQQAGPASWTEWAAAELRGIEEAGRRRSIRTFDGGGTTLTMPDGTSVVSFASNDYLGLSQHPAVVAAAHQALDRWGAGAGASRLIVGARPIHGQLEESIAAWRGSERALLFPTGYAANLGVLSTFGAGARIVSDELNHASIIDGARHARAEVAVYTHGDVDHAAHLVATAPGRVVLVSDTVFSMDGDVAPVGALSELCCRTGALLVLDDAHAVFDAPPVDPSAPCIRVGTLSKTLGALGGYATATSTMIDLLVNRARSFIFTTALTPADAAAALASVAIITSPEGASLRLRLRAHVDRLRVGHPSPIIPVVLGDERLALDAAEDLLAQGILVPAIRPPTVPAGTSRLRIAVSAAHTDEQLDALVGALRW